MLRYKALKRAGAVAWLWLLLLAVSPAAASPFDIQLVGTPTQQLDGTFLWEYQLRLAGGERVQTGPNTPFGPLVSSRPDFFVVYDFRGFTGTIAAPGGWSGASELVTTDPPDLQVGIPDDPTIPNLRFTRTGANVNGPVDIPGFTAVSVFGAQTGGFGSAEVTQNGGLQDNTNVVGTVSVPVPIPEPATVALVLAGPLFVFGAVRRGLRRRQV